MKKNYKLPLIITTFLMVVIIEIAATPKNKEKPNILIFIADDVSYSDFGCYGHPVIRTPNIDELARNGIKFTNAFLTTSSCSPSRISILTGRYPHNTGAAELHTDIPVSQELFPEMLKDAGYYTAQAGKWHLGSSGVAHSAFDRTGGAGNDGGGPSGSEKWVEYLKERPKNKPFFMWYASHDAHRGWDDQIFLQPYLPEEVIVQDYLVDSEKTRKDLAAYYNEVSRFDYFVGEAVKELKRQNAFENTLIIVMADNGRPFPRDKTRLYDNGIKTPFIVHWPEGVKERGKISESLLSVIDIAPTISEVANIKEPPAFQGKSFLDLLADPDREIRDFVFAEHNWHDFQAHERMVRTKQFLYIENGLPESDNRGAIDVMCGASGEELKRELASGRLNELQQSIFRIPQPERELYDCINDSLQLKNLTGEARYYREQEYLAKILDTWRKETGDSQPEDLTPDWYDRLNCSRLPGHGVRGIMPGLDKNAETINTSGPVTFDRIRGY
jgi:N-sulfoglucosamine sulfohydrolase